MFEHVQNQKYYTQIVSQIRAHIAEGKLKHGDRLPPERLLAQQFGTSRASIREALSALEILGLVESKSGQGNFIKAEHQDLAIDDELLKQVQSEHSPFEIYETRLELEPSLAALASERITPEEKEDLQRSLERLNRLGRELAGDPNLVEEYMDADRKLHLLIGRCAHNNVMFRVFTAVNLMMKERLWRLLKAKGVFAEGNLHKYEDEHTAIVRLICTGRAGEARETMRRHIRDVEKDIFEGERG